MHENHASIVALHRLKTFFKKSADTFASTQYYLLSGSNQRSQRIGLNSTQPDPTWIQFLISKKPVDRVELV